MSADALAKMSRSGNSERPLFAFTTRAALVGLALGGALFVLWAAWTFLHTQLSVRAPSPAVAISLLLFDLLMIGVTLFARKKQVRSVKFFDERFVANVGGVTSEFRYEQLKDVHYYVLFSGFRRRQVLNLELSDGRSLTIGADPRNAALNSDLYHWLQGRLDSSRVTV